jgi:hypothetical protein
MAVTAYGLAVPPATEASVKGRPAEVNNHRGWKGLNLWIAPAWP